MLVLLLLVHYVCDEAILDFLRGSHRQERAASVRDHLRFGNTTLLRHNDLAKRLRVLLSMRRRRLIRLAKNGVIAWGTQLELVLPDGPSARIITEKYHGNHW